MQDILVPEQGAPALAHRPDAHHYRPDIDGLRAIAVLAVLFFHADFAAFGGGFIGVDVFFVISGFLITRILINSVASGTFSIADFYRRRALRILPAYLAMCAASTLVALFLFPPAPLLDFSKSLLSSALFGANFYFAGQMNYFQSASEELPLLHMWSLSVEEQFYLIWPFAILILFSKPLWAKKAWLVGLAILFGVVFCEWAVRNKSQTMVFFYTPFRAWELMIGAFIALIRVPAMGTRACSALSWVGLLLIVCPVLLYQPHRPLFPGISSLVPCLGAALIIVTGSANATVIHRFLGHKILVFIGLISYSLYLWHWPLFAFVRYWNQGQLNTDLAVLLCILSLALAYMSWRFVETPFRRPPSVIAGIKSDRIQTTWILGSAASAITLTGAVAFAAIYNQGWPNRASEAALQAGRALESAHPKTEQCLRRRSPENVALPRSNCIFGDTTKPATVVLWGDSHANAFLPALEQRLKNQQVSFELFAMQSCTPILLPELEVDYGGRAVRACENFNRAVLAYIQATEAIRVVYVSSYWSSKYKRYIEATGGAEADFENLLHERVVRPLRDSGKKIVIVGQPPEFRHGGGRCLARKVFWGHPASDCDISLELYAATTGRVNQILGGVDDIEFIDPTPVFCDESSCTPYPHRVFAMQDEHHLTVEGALLMAEQGLEFYDQPVELIAREWQ